MHFKKSQYLYQYLQYYIKIQIADTQVSLNETDCNFSSLQIIHARDTATFL